MSRFRFILASLWYYRRLQLAVAAGVAVATAVITGALLVGDSVRGTLNALAQERLGRIETVLVAEQPFRASLAKQFTTVDVDADVDQDSNGAAPLWLTSGTLSSTHSPAGEGPGLPTLRRATALTVIGCERGFWQLGEGGPPALLVKNETAITHEIADELLVSTGDELILRLEKSESLPADSTLGEKDETTIARRLRVAAVLPGSGLARFGLRPSQHAPRNVFVPLEVVQEMLAQPDRINAVAIARPPIQSTGDAPANASLQEKLRPRLADFGVSVERIELGDSPHSAYLRITADRLVLPPPLIDAARRAFPDEELQPFITYLANTISIGKRQIPYSTITGVETTARLGPLVDSQGQPISLAEDEIVLNDWAAGDLQAETGDEVTVMFYEPETTHGSLTEAPGQRFRLRAIVPLTDPLAGRTRASDPQLTPDFPGVTDMESIQNWDLPFPLVEPIRDQDEQYWDEYRTTPKAFVSYRLAERLWNTRWGVVSGLRLPSTPELTRQSVAHRLEQQLDPAELGMRLVPVREQGLKAASGTTPFAGLFLGFSGFLIASAVMLIALLFRLGVEGRAREIGLLLASGMTVGEVRRLLLGEAAIVAALGAVVGVAAGVGYAQVMVYGLTTLWLAATVTPFMQLHVSGASMAIGLGAGLFVAVATIAWAVRRSVGQSPRELLAGLPSGQSGLQQRTEGLRRWLPLAMIVAAGLLGLLARGWEGEAQAGAFFCSGASVLAGLLVWLGQRLSDPPTSSLTRLSLWGLASRNARRHPSRTMLCIALAAVASFLIVALSAFRLAPTRQGTGDFDLLASSDSPLHFDLGSTAGRYELGLGDQAEQLLQNVEVVSFRRQEGEDASCLNLYQTAQPQILGVPPAMVGRGEFGWVAQTDPHPWQALQADLGIDKHSRPIVPIVLDKNTATYSLHLQGIGSRLTIQDQQNRPTTLQVVGLLSNSVLQGQLLMGEENFLRLFPTAGGYQFFLLRDWSGGQSIEQLATLLESRLEDYGFDVVPTRTKLKGFLAVQNTYLLTFQSLGALGLLLGMLGLAVVQLRSVLERRGELALLASAGFRPARMAQLVLSENLVLLFAGLGVGCVAALVVLLPHWLLQQAETPWFTLAQLLLLMVLAGIGTSWLAVRAVLRAPLLTALRGD